MYSPAHDDEPRVDRAVEGGEHLGDGSGRGDDHDEHDLGLQGQHLDVPDGGGVHRRRGDDGEQVGHLREGLGGRAHRLVHLSADE